MITVVDNTRASRFELTEQGLTAFADYRKDGAHIAIRHVEAPTELRGKGTAGRLMEGIVELARAEHWTLSLYCSYAATWFRRHPQHRDLLS